MGKNLVEFLSELKGDAVEAGASDATIIDAFKLIQDVGYIFLPFALNLKP